MPYSFTKIEEDKTKTIGLVFSFLILLYFIVFWLIVALCKNFMHFKYDLFEQKYAFYMMGLSESLIALCLAVVIGYVHWRYTVSNLIPKILGVLKAEKLNPKDTYHQMFQNIGEILIKSEELESETIINVAHYYLTNIMKSSEELQRTYQSFLMEYKTSP